MKNKDSRMAKRSKKWFGKGTDQMIKETEQKFQDHTTAITGASELGRKTELFQKLDWGYQLAM